MEAIIMMILTWMYNDLGCGDENYLLRNVINAGGLVCYSSGATVIAAGFQEHSLNNKGVKWLAIIWGVVFSTVQTQDLPDMEGDLAHKRRTLPLVLGEEVARLSVAVSVAIWSVVCPAFWDLGYLGYALPLLVGAGFMYRVLLLRGVSADKKTWRVWCIWTSTLWLLPLLKRFSIHNE